MPLSLALWAESVAGLERWLLPAECILCQGAAGPGEQLVCPLCRSRWRRLENPQCRRCGQPVEPGLECRLCLEWPSGFWPVRSAVWLEGTARHAVHLLKYEGWHRIARSLVEPMIGLDPLESGCVLVPIPLGAARQRTRGYNQSAKLAEQLGSRTGLRVDHHLLRRTRETTTQTALTPEARQANVRGAFAPGPVAPPAHVVLVDDVFTTGATLASAARSLLDGGIARVSAVTFARAERPLDSVDRALAGEM